MKTFFEACHGFFESITPNNGSEYVELPEEEKGPNYITNLWNRILDLFTYKLHDKDK